MLNDDKQRKKGCLVRSKQICRAVSHSVQHVLFCVVMLRWFVSVWWIMVWAVPVHVLWLNLSDRTKVWKNCGEWLQLFLGFIFLESDMHDLCLSLLNRLNKNCISKEGVDCMVEALKMNTSVKKVW